MPKFELEPVTGGIIADAVKAYLEQPHKLFDQAVLDEMMAAYRKTVMRQIMSARSDRKGKESTTTYTHPCARKARLTYDGAPRADMQARTVMKFLLGDMVELTVLGIAKLAGLDIGLNNEDLTVLGRDGALIPVHPDGLLHQADEWWNVEIKSTDSRTFDTWLEQGGPSNDWGYRTQASLEIQAWRESGLNVNETCFVAVSTGTRQGSVAEWRLPYDAALVEEWHARRELAKGKDVPAIPYKAVAETEFMKGKEMLAEWCYHGEPTPRLDKNGRVHGWDVPTGRQIVPVTPCGYCDYVKTQCWTTADLDVQGGAPRWIVPEPRNPHLASKAEFDAYMAETLASDLAEQDLRLD